MERLLVAGLVYGAFLLLSLWRPRAGRAAVGLFFLLMALAVNLPLMILAPYAHVEFGSHALLAPYRWVFTDVVALAPAVFVGLLVLYQVAVGVLILSVGPAVRLGLAGALVFLLAIMPLSAETLVNPVLVLAIVLLMRQRFERSLVPTPTLRHRKSAAHVDDAVVS